ncbi:hypothetical protein DICVIV_05512 [Dictyocaulus viviparus]|uniref:Uncharacterized protein n=1 Tax=Dictyocaulus viviparus TaxID=29172 RepID=A0A0D8XX53_DICVI|nr:hypothetical protein DICVIV_05512 [Dictyocaulus viviparus]
MAVSTEASRSDCSVLNVTLDSDNETNTVCVRTSARENKVTYPSPASTWVSVGSVISSGSVENAQDSNYCMNGTNNNHGEQRILITTNVGSENHNVTSDDNIYEGIGPCIPPGVMITSCSDQEDSSGDIDMEPFGPLPPPPSLNVSDDDNSDFGKDVGPLPFHGECDSAALEYAHLRMQLESKEDESMPKREEWMLKVPKKSVMSKLDARQFKRGSSVNTDFDASWEEIHHAKKFRIEVFLFLE